MKIVATADLHGNLPETPECDVLVIAGDICPDLGSGGQLDWIDTDFRQWLMAQPATHIIGIAGNHDFVFQSRPGKVENLVLPWIYLQDSGITINGVKFYGIPWVPKLASWAFYADDRTLGEKYQAVPKDTNVLISHGPPYSACDFTCEKFGSKHVGSMAAMACISDRQPRHFICGHIHEAFGEEDAWATTVHNVSYVDENYNVRGILKEIEYGN